jgi:hypothetical protein
VTGRRGRKIRKIAGSEWAVSRPGSRLVESYSVDLPNHAISLLQTGPLSADQLPPNVTAIRCLICGRDITCWFTLAKSKKHEGAAREDTIFCCCFAAGLRLDVLVGRFCT